MRWFWNDGSLLLCYISLFIAKCQQRQENAEFVIYDENSCGLMYINTSHLTGGQKCVQLQLKENQLKNVSSHNLTLRAPSARYLASE